MRSIKNLLPQPLLAVAIAGTLIILGGSVWAISRSSFGITKKPIEPVKTVIASTNGPTSTPTFSITPTPSASPGTTPGSVAILGATTTTATYGLQATSTTSKLPMAPISTPTPLVTPAPAFTFTALTPTISMDPGLAGPVYSYTVVVKLRISRINSYNGSPTMWLSGVDRDQNDPECHPSGWPPQPDYSYVTNGYASDGFVWNCSIVNQITVPHGKYTFTFTAQDTYFHLTRTAQTTLNF